MLCEIPRGANGSAMVLLMGVSGSGKSTFARRHFRKTEIVSSDTCRALISDNEADQSASADAFELLHMIVDKRLKRGRVAVIDATNVQAWGRASLIEIANRHGSPVSAIVLDVPERVYRTQNKVRSARVVEESVLDQQATDLRKSLAGLEAEGVTRIHMLRSVEELHAVKVVTG